MIHYDEDAEIVGGWIGEETGHYEYAYTEMLSVDNEGKLFFGYDGSFNTDKFSINERRALADIMIARWTKWKEEQK